MDKQKLEEVRQLAMSMTSRPVAFGTIEHTEKAGELLGLLWQEVQRLQCDLKDALSAAEKTPRDPLEIEELWDEANERREKYDEYGPEVYELFARLLERAHGIGVEHG